MDATWHISFSWDGDRFSDSSLSTVRSFCPDAKDGDRVTREPWRMNCPGCMVVLDALVESGFAEILKGHHGAVYRIDERVLSVWAPPGDNRVCFTCWLGAWLPGACPPGRWCRTGTIRADRCNSLPGGRVPVPWCR